MFAFKKVLCSSSFIYRSSGQWTTGPGGGSILARQDSLSSSLSKVHDNKSDDSDPGRHGFLYVEYTVSSVTVPSFKAAFEHDDVFQNSFGYSQDVHVTIQPFDFILWCPLLYTVATVFHTFASLQSDSVGKCESQGVPLLDPGVETHQSLTNLPEINLKLRGFRVVVPSCIDPRMLTGKQDHSGVVNNSDLFTIQASSLLVSSQLENPISRLVLDKKLSKALTAFARSRRGSAAEGGLGDTQYKIEVKGLRIWSGCWEELCRMLPNQDPSRIERDLLEQNPALEWNTHSGWVSILSYFILIYPSLPPSIIEIEKFCFAQEICFWKKCAEMSQKIFHRKWMILQSESVSDCKRHFFQFEKFCADFHKCKNSCAGN